jgi:hypothetical protein
MEMEDNVWNTVDMNAAVGVEGDKPNNVRMTDFDERRKQKKQFDSETGESSGPEALSPEESWSSLTCSFECIIFQKGSSAALLSVFRDAEQHLKE